jgi:hypothetical protein
VNVARVAGLVLLVLAVAGLCHLDAGKARRQQYVSDLNDTGGENLYFVAQGVLSDRLAAVPHPACRHAEADAWLDQMTHDKDNREILDGLRALGFTKLSCGEVSVDLRAF